MANNHKPDDLQTNQVHGTTLRHTFENGQLSCLDCDLTSIPKELVEDFCNITSRLDLSFNKLVSLQGLEHFNFLKELVLDSNELGDNVVFPALKDLQTLTLNKNKFTDLSYLMDQLVSCCPNLIYLSLLGNQACPNQLSSYEKDEEDYQRYRYYVLYRIPKLKFLDSTPVTPSEILEAKRVGPYQQIVRPKNMLENSESLSSSSPTTLYTPLPSETQDVSQSDHHDTEEESVSKSKMFHFFFYHFSIPFDFY
ncbi:hypothetical protein Btru_004822 [Bulinus truncatus]|nr:hypothetical protein Btru_004822 [Bulinus truncatus]